MRTAVKSLRIWAASLKKYRRIFGWDIPEIDQHAADKLILAAIHTALDDIATQLAD
jgi:hypothetical protein